MKYIIYIRIEEMKGEKRGEESQWRGGDGNEGSKNRAS